ncbi:hypothetical protein JB92DRAFT_3082204 [Gautieria morchelliformis]|nr:hypothetical protein JB92DRAFT_3082204 [Gautieria morchelliformis]
MDPEEDIELLSPDEAQVLLTEHVAEKLRAISTSENDPSLSLRIAVESGGCHGYQYKMELTSQRAPDDYQFIHRTHRSASIVIDAVSVDLLKGSTVNYATELISSSFRIIDNPQAKGSGCGSGVSREAKF